MYVATTSRLLDQGHRSSRRADFALVNNIGENVARSAFTPARPSRFDTGQIVRRSAFRPSAQAARPRLDLFRRISRRDGVLAALQPRINKRAGRIGYVGIFDVVCEHHWDGEAAQQRDEFNLAEAVMAHLDDMVQLLPV